MVTHSDSSKCSQQVTAHEFGHFVQYNAIKKLIDRRCKEKYSKLIQEYRDTKSSDIANQIKEIHKKMGYSINNQIALISKKNIWYNEFR